MRLSSQLDQPSKGDVMSSILLRAPRAQFFVSQRQETKNENYVPRRGHSALTAAGHNSVSYERPANNMRLLACRSAMLVTLFLLGASLARASEPEHYDVGSGEVIDLGAVTFGEDGSVIWPSGQSHLQYGSRFNNDKNLIGPDSITVRGHKTHSLWKNQNSQGCRKCGFRK